MEGHDWEDNNICFGGLVYGYGKEMNSCATHGKVEHLYIRQRG